MYPLWHTRTAVLRGNSVAKAAMAVPFSTAKASFLATNALIWMESQWHWLAVPERHELLSRRQLW